MMESDLKINLPGAFTVEQERLILKYLKLGRRSLVSSEWKELLVGFNVLHNAELETTLHKLTFSQVYEEYVDIPFADSYINRLLTLEDVVEQHISLWAETARAVVAYLRQKQLYRVEIPQTNLLLAYCLYFWESFTKGYAFEVEVYRDLAKSGIDFQAHDIRDRQARFSAHDLVVLNLNGDVKTSTYFLFVGRGLGLAHDFYITRLYEGKHQRTLVAMLQLAAWNEIDGDTIVGLLNEATRYFPAPVLVRLEQGTIVIAEYGVWKEKVLSSQQSRKE